MTNEEYSDYALVRDALIETQKRRGFLTYEQKMALQHAEWSASDQRNGYKTESKVFQEMLKLLLEIDLDPKPLLEEAASLEKELQKTLRKKLKRIILK